MSLVHHKDLIILSLLKPIQISPINRITVSWNFSQLVDKDLLNILLLSHVDLRRRIYLGQVYVCIWDELNFLVYLHFQLIFATIHISHYIFWYYS